jgi:ComF family protein
MKRLTNRLTNALFPGVCLCCGLASGRDLCLCQGCEDALPQLDSQCLQCAEPLALTGLCGHCQKSPPAFSRIVAPYRYQFPLDRLILGLKHHRQLAASQVLGHLLAKHLRTIKVAPDVVVAMPLHWRRRWMRGYNQARELARAVAGELQLPLADDRVCRSRHTAMQQQFNRSQRRANVNRAFTATGPCNGLHMAVVDDVVTTASTARAIAACLTNAGASKVEIWCVARTTLEN